MAANPQPMPPINPTLESDSNFDLAIAFVWRHRRLLLLTACLGGAVGFGTSYLFAPQFKAYAILVPSDAMRGSSLDSALGNLGGLASLVGLDKSGNKESEALETLKSRALTTSYIEANGLLSIIFHDQWDAGAHKWKPGRRVPTLADGYRKFDKSIRTVVDNRKTGLVTISVTWEDPVLAQQWTIGLVDAANDLLRKQAIERSARNLEYLNKASNEATAMEIKATIYKLVETEIKKQMVAFGDMNYAFRVVDPAVVPDRKDFPSRSIFLLLGALAAPAFSSLIIAMRRSIIAAH
jgi:uncharacterized protein involved in exopolysaccharide biosynthesis